MKRPTRAPWLVAASAALAFTAATTAQIHVDEDAPPGGDGLSWDTAHRFLQDAMAHAALLTPPVEVRVAAGVYKPDVDEAGNVTPLDREATFQLVNGVALLGGYAGLGAPDPGARNIVLHVTTLSGDLQGNDLPDFANYADNSWHVVTGSGADATAVIDGFTVSSGYADGPIYPASFDAMGAGMHNVSGSPTIRACTFSWNRAVDNGAGMANLEDSSPLISDSAFEHNRMDASPGVGGGAGMVNALGGQPRITGCTFSANWANYGGGVQNVLCSPLIIDCVFSDNEAFYSGGGLVNDESSNAVVISCTFIGNRHVDAAAGGGAMANTVGSGPTVINCLFKWNEGTGGAGVLNWQGSDPTVTNCTFVGNDASTAGGGMWSGSDSHAIVTNCVFWDNAGGQIVNVSGSTTAVTYSDVEGGYGGAGNISTDPKCRDLPGGDMRLASGSPCIDAGDNTALPADTWDLDGDGDTTEPIPLDLGGLPRFVDDPDAIDSGNPDGIHSLVDMGAHEFCRADAMPDGVVDVQDLVAVILAWGSNDMDADTNADGIVDVQDLVAVILNWGPCV